MSWMEEGGAGWEWMELGGGGWKWVHALVIPFRKELI